jgi:hypothetical protein
MTPRRRPRREMTVEQFRECEATVVSVVRRFALEVSLTWTQRDDLVFAGMDEAGRMFLRWRSYGLKDKLGEYVSHGVALRISKEIARMRSPAYVPRDELADLDVDQHGWADVGDAYIEGLAGEEIDRDTETEAAEIDARLNDLAAGDVRVALLLDVERDGMRKDVSAKRRGIWHNRAAGLREEGREVIRRDPVMRRLRGLAPLPEDVALVEALCAALCALASWERPAPRPFRRRRRAAPCNLWPRPRRAPSPPVVRHGRRSASLREGGCGHRVFPRAPVALPPSWPPSGARAGPGPAPPALH